MRIEIMERTRTRVTLAAGLGTLRIHRLSERVRRFLGNVDRVDVIIGSVHRN